MTTAGSTPEDGYVRVKICGVTSIAEALACVDDGADAIGINLVPGTPRAVPVNEAIAIARALGDRAEPVFVVVDRDPDELRAILDAAPTASAQLHGEEEPAHVEALLPRAFKALRIGGEGDVARAATYPGDRVLTDARAHGVLGGSGQTFDWSLVADLARARRLVLAGGLTPDNVARAIAQVHPFAVDVAGGVETPGAPRTKDRERVRAFVAAVRAASG